MGVHITDQGRHDMLERRTGCAARTNWSRQPLPNDTDNQQTQLALRLRLSHWRWRSGCLCSRVALEVGHQSQVATGASSSASNSAKSPSTGCVPAQHCVAVDQELCAAVRRRRDTTVGGQRTGRGRWNGSCTRCAMKRLGDVRIPRGRRR